MGKTKRRNGRVYHYARRIDGLLGGMALCLHSAAIRSGPEDSRDHGNFLVDPEHLDRADLGLVWKCAAKFYIAKHSVFAARICYRGFCRGVVLSRVNSRASRVNVARAIWWRRQLRGW